MTNRMFILVMAFALMGTILAQENQNDISNRIPAVEISGTELLSIHSDITGEDYNLYISLPRDYKDTTKTFPAVYLIDAQWDFPLVSAIFGEQYYDGFLPALVIVGITWRGTNPDYDSLRARDLSPVTMNQPKKYGNASKFLRSIKEEIIPLVEHKFRISKDDRTLMGSSFGGLFTLYALFNETNSFRRYVLTSPAIKWDKGVIYNYEKFFDNKNHGAPIKLYMAIGSYEDVDTFLYFSGDLKKKNFNDLEITSEVIERMGHSGAKAEGFSRGLQTVFSHSYLKINPEILKQYTGTYQVDSTHQIKVFLDGGNLQMLTPENDKYLLEAESKTDFHAKGRYDRLHFKKNLSGNINGFEYEQFSKNSFVPKI